MSQNYNDELYEQSTVADTTLTRVENNFAAVKSNFSGSSNPSDGVSGMLHMRTGGTADGLRVRNADNDEWMKILEGDAGQKMWVYRNDTCEGWTIDATVTDRVLALKGGSDAYNANGGTNAGETWANLLGHTHDFSEGGFNADNGTFTNYGVGDGKSGFSHLIDLETQGVNSITDLRPAAAVGTLQYPDLS